MRYTWDRVSIWAAEVVDKSGGVASKLAHLAEASANLEYIFTQRLPNKPGTGILYVAPVTGAAQVRAAREAGMHEVEHPVVRRIEGDNEAGLGYRLTQQWAIAGISFHGLTMAVLSDRFVGYATFDSVDDANRAAQILADLGTSMEGSRKPG